MVKIIVTASRGMAAEEYLDAVREAGGEPVRVEPGEDGIGAAFEAATGLLVTGGVDVDPAAYHGSASPYITETEPERDLLEIELLRAARERSMPTLCICRGLQIANVAFGGTLIADIPEYLGEKNAIRHLVPLPDGRSDRGLVAEHVVRINPGSALARFVVSPNLVTGARHHQAVDTISSDLRVVGKTDDGIVEALEAKFAAPFWLAVQWHPESTLTLDNGASRALFGAFVKRCLGA